MIRLVLLLCAGSLAAAHGTDGMVGNGFIGYGINMYHPWCAHACKDTISTSSLVCNDTVDHMDGMDHDMAGMEMKKRMDMDHGPSLDCIASNGPYLQSLAYCVDMHCATESTPQEVEEWWYGIMLGREVDKPRPAMSFAQSLASLSSPPNTTLAEGEMMTGPILVDEESYMLNYNGDAAFETVEQTHAEYGIILLVTCAAIPIALSSFSWIPFPAAVTSKFSSYLIEAPLISQPITLPLVGPLNLPNRGQSLFILYIVGMNIILCSVGYSSRQPNGWFDSTTLEIATYISNRTGVLSFANVPLLILYAGRNNILLYMTNWSHSTFLLLHRVVATMATLEACLHSAIYLQIKLAEGTHSSESKLPYWIWGIVATLTMSLLLPLSMRFIRVRAYELFLITHILLSVFAIVGCWYHIIIRFGRQWGYENWLYIAIAAWGFDRLARFARIGRWGLKRAKVYKIDDDYLRIDIGGISASGHVYIYFPTVTWKVWENHPFSVAGVGSTDAKVDIGLSRKTSGSGDAEKADRDDGSSDDIQPAASSSVHGLEKGPVIAVASHHVRAKGSNGITLFVRNREGLTSALASRASPISENPGSTGIPVLVEGSYGKHIHNSLASLAYDLERYPNILILVGGVGITAFLPLLQDLRGINPKLLPSVSAKLFWGVRNQSLVSAVEHMLEPSAPASQTALWGMVEPHISIGGRLDLFGIADKELGKKGTMVLVCGPQSLADEARRVMMLKARDGAVVKFLEEKFDW